MNTLYDIRKNAIEELHELAKTDSIDFIFNNDVLYEIADLCTPVYTSDLMQLAADNIRLATDTPEIGPAFSGESTPVNIVAANVYEYILGELWEELEKMRETA